MHVDGRKVTFQILVARAAVLNGGIATHATLPGKNVRKRVKTKIKL